MGGTPKPPDNSAQIALAKAQHADLEKKNKELQMKKEVVQTRATADFNAKRRGQTGRQSLIATSEKGVLGSTGKLG